MRSSTSTSSRGWSSLLRRRHARSAARAAGILAIAIGAAGFGGCNIGGGADTERGRALFTQNCGACHTLAQAGTSSAVGPNLDATFVDARESGMTDATIESVVRNQIANPRFIREDDPLYDQVFMPADIVTGQDARDVSAYIGAVAGVADIAPPEMPPDQLFVDRCGGCHTLQAAGTSATTGPDLDEVLPGQDAAMIEEAIVNPEARITPGFPAGVMPSFEGVLSADELTELVQYLIESTGGATNGNGAGGNGSGANGNGGGGANGAGAGG